MEKCGIFFGDLYAGMMDIPTSLYEAARVDGAGNMRQFFSITLPMLKPITYLVVTLGTIWSFQVFDLVYTLTGGGPGRATTTLVLTIYNSAFKKLSNGICKRRIHASAGCCLSDLFLAEGRIS